MILKKQETLFKSYLQVDRLTLEHEGKEFYRELIPKLSGVGAIVYNTETNKYIFVSQWRPGSKTDIIECVAGLIDHDGEDKEDTICREVEEEIGYKVGSVVELVKEFYTSPGFSNEKITMYYCEVSEQINEGGGVDSEDEVIEIIEKTPQEILFMREFTDDAKTITGLLQLQLNNVKNRI